MRKAIALAALFLLSVAAQAQTVTSNVVSLALSTTVGESATLSCSTASLVLAINPTNFTCTTTWNVTPNRSQLNGVVFFSGANALTSPAGTIPTSAVVISTANTGPCNLSMTVSNTPFTNACPNFLQIAINTGNDQGTNTSTIGLAIPTLNSFPPSNAYTGSANLEILVN